MYAVSAHGGHLQWELKADKPAAVITDILQVGGSNDAQDCSGSSSSGCSSDDSDSRTSRDSTGAPTPQSMVYLSLFGGASSWLQAINVTSGAVTWTSGAVDGEFDKLAWDNIRCACDELCSPQLCCSWMHH